MKETLSERGCPSPANVCARRSSHRPLNLQPLLYPSTENSQELVFGGHNARQTEGTPDPVFPRTPYRNILGLIYFHADHYQEALDWFERSDALGGPHNPAMLAYRAANYALQDREQEARSILALLNKHDGAFDWKDWLYRVYKNERYAEQVLQPLRELESNLD